MNEAIKLTCPVCQQESNQMLHLALNTQTHPQLKKKLLDGSLLTFECDYCGAKRRMTVPFLYHDPNNQYLFYLSPHYTDRKDEVKAKLQEILQDFPLSLENYEMRLITDPSSLIEKIQLFDMGYHDTEIELVKMLTDGLFTQENPDLTIQSRYFYLNDKQEANFIYFANNQQYLVNFNDKLLIFIRDKFKKTLSQSYTGSFMLINELWADSCLQKNANDSSSNLS